jgi:ABC-type uncharacterized transport system ATPase subunit
VDVKPPEQYKRDIPHTEVVVVRCQGQPDTAAIQALPGVERMASEFKDGITELKVVAPRAEAVLSDIIELLRKQSKILGIDVKQPTLEDVFLYVTGTSLGADTTEVKPGAE